MLIEVIINAFAALGLFAVIFASALIVTWHVRDVRDERSIDARLSRRIRDVRDGRLR